MRTNLHHLLEHGVASHGTAPAVTYKHTSLSYTELWREVCAVAAKLASLGVQREQRVAVYLEKRTEAVAAIFGISAAGGVFVPINPLLRPPQVAHILADCKARLLITSQERLELLLPVLNDGPELAHILLVDAGAASETPGDACSVHAWPDSLSSEEPAPLRSDTIDLDMAAIFYTSGSTGKPKGVVLSHRNLIVGAESVSQYLENTANDVILAALPLSFDAGFSQLTTAFSVGAHVVLMNYLLPGDVVRLCVRHGVTGLTCVPPLWIQIADHEWPPEAARPMRYFANTGGKLPKAVLDKLRVRFPQAKPFLMYGLTEAFRSTYLDPTEIDRRPGSIGKAIPNAEILVVRPDGSRCGPGEEGELVHRGALVAMGYWNDPERTAARFRPVPGRDASWRTPEIAVWSGDTVVADEEGFLYFVGRKDDMIKTSGYRVSPTEIEEEAYATGMVRDAVALGVDDSTLGQRVLLVASPAGPSALDPAALVKALKRRLPHYMVPSSIVIRNEVPRSPNGKFDRSTLRKELASWLSDQP
ncbi:acyl-CoA ligase (AMP-forming), exosortase A system-associated [Bradyrhizobium sp. CNPSo 4010]|uniref:Acyl-CoA ligase (AMP-forming), exosortase A system-associated n=1 Tax=Bradyrhizobium agreste TaxID=2751811 RepID=A0ABS0PM22_9BRAD|nr:acyl-CoA ligase (AMP-forming), exosortase A system-associated [Bradyrhizobium agreste]MBH5398259.1 acyl-CoA ligase (AMP-forming), exosortase A system-associated [Bradyrhizobium agreste]